MKIAIIAHARHAVKQPFVGGLETHTYQLISELKRQGHDVTIYAKAGTKTPARLVTIFRGNAWDGKNPTYNQAYRRAMRLISNSDFDLIINNSLNHVPLEVHDAAMPPMVTIFHTPPLPKMAAVLESQMSIANRTYIAVSEFTAMQWQKHCQEPVQTVPNGMDFSNWKTVTHGPKKVSASWVGRITPEKGTHVAIEACIKAGIPLTIGGNIYDKKYFAQRIKPLLNNQLITYVGHIDHAGVNKLFAESSVALVTPLWDEPFGLVEIEAWASGTPVAALPNGALPSLVHDAVGKLAQDNSAASLEKAIKQALTANRLECYAYARDNFSLATMVNAYLALAPRDVTNNSMSMSMSWLMAR